jgi:hypothetical protein
MAPVLGFFFSVYGLQSATVPRVTLEILQESKVMAKTSTDLRAPDARGRSQNAGALPLSSLAPGAYTLKVSVPDGQGVHTREAAFTLAE